MRSLALYIARARADVDYSACAKHKMATKTSGNAGRAFQFRYLTVSASIFVAKDQSRLVIESFDV